MNEKNQRIFRQRLTIAIVVLLVIGFVGYLFASNALTLYELEQQKNKINKDLEEVKNYENQLDEQIKQMGSKSYVEYIARRYLQLYYPDEIIVIPVEGEASEVPEVPEVPQLPVEKIPETEQVPKSEEKIETEQVPESEEEIESEQVLDSEEEIESEQVPESEEEIESEQVIESEVSDGNP